jgi:hypothetical protein
MYLDCARAVEIHVTLHEEERTMDTLAPSEEDNIRPAPRPKVKRADPGSPKLTGNDFTCNEADVDGLLSAGELT